MIKINNQIDTNKESILAAAKKYDEYKYPEDFYIENLEVLKRVKEINEETLIAIKNLFFWKLGKIKISNPLDKLKKLQNEEYHYINTTQKNYLAIEKAFDLDRVKSGLEFRDDKLSYGNFKLTVNQITETSIVLPAFYIHIWKPQKFPMIDIKVWKVYIHSIGKPVFKYTKPKNFNDYEKYLIFFKNLLKDTGLDWRTVDKGLWVIGENQ